MLVPIAFVSEHSETLVELDIEYKEIAYKNGCKNYTRIPALGTNENYIKKKDPALARNSEKDRALYYFQTIQKYFDNTREAAKCQN